MIKEILEKYIENRKNKPLEHRDRLYPTFASCYVTFSKYKRLYGKCMRAAYYSCIGEEESTEPGLNLSMQRMLGEYTEKMILDCLKRQDSLKDKNVPFAVDKYNIYGKLDGIVLYNGKEYGLEIKSISGANAYINYLIFENNNPRWQDLFQTIIYCYAFRDTLPNGFILFYIRRDTGDIKEITVQVEPYNNELSVIIDGKVESRYKVKDLLDRYVTLYKYIQANKVPPREYIDIYPVDMIPDYYKLGILSKKQVDAYNIKPFGDSACIYCGYKHLCKNEEK